ncbi:Growth/differentiation factor 8 [Acropora cervicornis]|uniref:Growth/differentiation factor 8 n=1 Tax=Acropora cervicornis TaxID=6130 RepID=A0AAD9Q8G8_ACRCE|nr:Growth/differentiation factor 8 [Acropora cervicornis]
MIGLLSYSAFLTLYLIAIAFPQGAYLSLETKTTRDEKTFVSNPYRAAQPSKSTSSQKSEEPSLQKDTMQHRCPSCNDSAKENEDLLVTKQRIEMIKAKILEKLQMDKEPEVSQNFKEARIAALLSKLNLIGEENKENQPESPEDGFYGKTTQIITFSEEDKVPLSQSKGHAPGKMEIYFKFEKHTLTSSIASVLFWLNTNENIELEGKYLDIEALDKRAVQGNTEEQDIKVVRFQVKKLSKSRSGWIVVDVKDIVQNWFSKSTPVHFNNTHKPIYGLNISCRDCETKINHLISSRGPLRPFLVIDLDKPKVLRRRKRQPLDCVGTQPEQECCRRKLYVNFTAQRWDWIIHPSGFSANYCDGRCQKPNISLTPEKLSKHKTVPIKNESICCSPSKYSPFSMMFYDGTSFRKIDMTEMKIEACSCS